MVTRNHFLVLLAPVLLGGCVMVMSPVGNGSIYTQVHSPLATGPGTSAAKTGRACAANYLGVVAVGDASIEAAKKHGGISNVVSVDGDAFTVMGVYGRFCTIVTGS